MVVGNLGEIGAGLIQLVSDRGELGPQEPVERASAGASGRVGQVERQRLRNGLAWKLCCAAPRSRRGRLRGCRISNNTPAAINDAAVTHAAINEPGCGGVCGWIRQHSAAHAVLRVFDRVFAGCRPMIGSRPQRDESASAERLAQRQSAERSITSLETTSVNRHAIRPTEKERAKACTLALSESKLVAARSRARSLESILIGTDDFAAVTRRKLLEHADDGAGSGSCNIGSYVAAVTTHGHTQRRADGIPGFRCVDGLICQL